MASGIVRDEGLAKTSQAMSTSIDSILKLVGEAEKTRQQRGITEQMIQALGSNNPDAFESVMQAAGDYQVKYGEGLGGFLQKFGARHMQGDPRTESLAGFGLPAAKMKSDMDRSQAMSQYYRGEGRQPRGSMSEYLDINKTMSIIQQRYAESENPEGYLEDEHWKFMERKLAEHEGGAGIEEPPSAIGAPDPSTAGRVLPPPGAAAAAPDVAPAPQAGGAFDTSRKAPLAARVAASLPSGADPAAVAMNNQGPPAPQPAAFAIENQGPPAPQKGGAFDTSRRGVPQAVGTAQPITAINPQTGERVQWDGKKWLPIIN